MPQLDPTWFASQLFWLLLTFAALYFVLAKFLLPPLASVLERRQQTLASDVDMAQRFKSEAERARQDYERTLADARARAQKLMADATADQKMRGEEAARDMDRQVTHKLMDAERRILAQKNDLLDALKPTAAELAAMIVEKLTLKTPGSEQVSALIGELSKNRAQRG